MADIVILGGGFGGLAAAAAVAPAAHAGHRVTLVERRREFLMGLRKLWMLTGRSTRQEGARPLDGVRKHGAVWLDDEVVAIEPDRKRVRTAREELPYDFLIVALGAQPRPDLVAGFEHALNLYDADEVERLAPRVAEFAGGRVAVGILGLPYKCPPAPYEAVMLMDDHFRRRGVRDRVEMVAFTPQPTSLPVAGPDACAAVEGQLAAKGIRFEPNRRVRGIEAGRVVFEDGAVEFDLLVAVPPHRPPAVVKDSGLTSHSEWIRPDPRTMRTGLDGVFAVGDVTEILMPNGMPLPKAGVFAESQAQVAVSQILRELGLTETGATFSGAGYCFIEVGGGMAAKVHGDFLALPAPDVRVSSPSERVLEEKRAFEQERLAAWL
ncbi:MAG: FAD/NAD(P)-binding oxidoreductase [Armatimonadota bacterium]|nr:FAD/NAD(P)-binding oxidoreductase [Armatimonadota bacterium]MDR5696427.1 FAD/NAD(P)-binding oxidoreductase [Armatimonadota bacterium]